MLFVLLDVGRVGCAEGLLCYGTWDRSHCLVGPIGVVWFHIRSVLMSVWICVIVEQGERCDGCCE